MAVKRTKKSAAVKSVGEKFGAVAVEEKPKRAKAKASVSNAYIVIDHPVENETVSGLHYAVRIGASEGNVEVSIDGGEWQPARNAAGYWWYDWGYFTPGVHKMTARLVDQNGKTLKKSLVRKVQVI